MSYQIGSHILLSMFMYACVSTIAIMSLLSKKSKMEERNIKAWFEDQTALKTIFT